MKRVAAAVYQYFRSIDRTLLFFCALASALSVLLQAGIAHSGYVRDSRIYVQLIASGIGIAVAMVAAKIDYRLIARLWKWHTGASYALVLLTFFVGLARDDDRAWLPMPFGFTLQPSEILKISFIITFALHLQKVREGINQPKVLLQVCLHGAAPIALVVLQGDVGSAMIFVFIFVAMMFSAGLSWKYIATGAVGAVLAVPLVWNVLMDEHKRMRFMAVYDWTLDPLGVGLQQRYGRRALGSGQVFGKGLFYGDHQYVPEMYNDFIFTFVGEALGFLGCLLVIVLLLVIIYRVLTASALSQDHLGRYICIGIFGMLASQIIINLGMCLSLLPVVGVTLPLLSSGGTSILSVYMSIGLVLSVYSHNKANLFSDN